MVHFASAIYAPKAACAGDRSFELLLQPISGLFVDPVERNSLRARRGRIKRVQDGARRAVRQSRTPLDLIVLEASSIVEIDFTAAQILIEFTEFCAQSNIRFAVARLESVRAAEAFERLGITDAVHRDHFFHSVDEAIRVLAKKTNEFPEDKE